MHAARYAPPETIKLVAIAMLSTATCVPAATETAANAAATAKPNRIRPAAMMAATGHTWSQLGLTKVHTRIYNQQCRRKCENLTLNRRLRADEGTLALTAAGRRAETVPAARGCKIITALVTNE